jgi:hypothetical protein
MKVTYNCKKINTVFEFDVDDVKKTFDQLAHIQEIFEQEKCGKCGNTGFKLSRRDVAKGSKTFTYREVVCQKCFHRLSIGQKLADQSLFPQRNYKDGTPKENNGWVKYEATPDE